MVAKDPDFRFDK